MSRGLAGALVVIGATFVSASPAVAAPPVLTSVSHVNRHPAATWTLPPGVKSTEAEVAVSPATSTDGYFFSENVKAFDVLQGAQTNWVYNFQLDPGTYYLHIAGIDEPCFFAGLCPVREFSQIMTLVIAAPEHLRTRLQSIPPLGVPCDRSASLPVENAPTAGLPTSLARIVVARLVAALSPI
jgi:hypothetical protein